MKGGFTFGDGQIECAQGAAISGKELGSVNLHGLRIDTLTHGDRLAAISLSDVAGPLLIENSQIRVVAIKNACGIYVDSSGVGGLITIQDNRIEAIGDRGTKSSEATGIELNLIGQASINAQILDNTIREVRASAAHAGIRCAINGGEGGNSSLTLAGNTFNALEGSSGAAIEVTLAGSAKKNNVTLLHNIDATQGSHSVICGTQSTLAGSSCWTIWGNSASPDSGGIDLTNRGASTFQIQVFNPSMLVASLSAANRNLPINIKGAVTGSTLPCPPLVHHNKSL